MNFAGTANEALFLPMGYRLRATGETISYSDVRLRESKDEFYHWCTPGGEGTGRTICLYRPPMGF